MGKSTKSTLDNLKDDLKTLTKDDMDKFLGGQGGNTKWGLGNPTRNTKWNTGIGGIVPQ